MGLPSQGLLGIKTVLLGTAFCDVISPHSACRAESLADSHDHVSVVCFAPPWLSYSSVSGTGIAADGDHRPWRGLNLSHLETPKRRTSDPKVALQTSTLNESAWRSVQSPWSQAVAGLCNLPRKSQGFCNSASLSSVYKLAVALNCSHQSHQLSCHARDEEFICVCRKTSEVSCVHTDVFCNSLGWLSVRDFPKNIIHAWRWNNTQQPKDSRELRHG